METTPSPIHSIPWQKTTVEYETIELKDFFKILLRREQIYIDKVKFLLKYKWHLKSQLIYTICYLNWRVYSKIELIFTLKL